MNNYVSQIVKALRQHPVRPEWTGVNTAFLVLAVLLIPLEYILFYTGELHSKIDQAAVALTFIQYIIINLFLIPWRTRTSTLSIHKKRCITSASRSPCNIWTDIIGSRANIHVMLLSEGRLFRWMCLTV